MPVALNELWETILYPQASIPDATFSLYLANKAKTTVFKRKKS